MTEEKAAREGFPRRLRLRRRRDFLSIQRRGARGSTDALVVIGRRARGEGRVGFTVSKKVGKAHARNRVKRRLRHILRTNKQLFARRDLIVVVQPRAVELSFDALKAALFEAVRRMEQALEKQGDHAPKKRRGKRGRKPPVVERVPSPQQKPPAGERAASSSSAADRTTDLGHSTDA